MNEIIYQEKILKSTHPEQYPDLVVKCRVIKSDEVKDYVSSIPEEDKCTVYKSAPVMARPGIVGEEITTVLKVVYEGKEYILDESFNKVKEAEMPDGSKRPGVVVTNISSPSQEEYVVGGDKFEKLYTANMDGTFSPVPDNRLAAKLSEDVIVVKSWGSIIGLKGSYLVNGNPVEAEAFENTYSIVNDAHQKNM
ncbi:MAG: hypothetical protein IKG27_04345 [Bacilli bacterium]|nr:hypothetical protein [Bacilli bacterium]